MRFCPKCGGILRSKVIDNSRVLYCASCGYILENVKGQFKVMSNIIKRKEIIVSDISSAPLPKTEVECPKCGHNEAYWWMIQTRSADEAPTTFYRCVNCGHTWRDYR